MKLKCAVGSMALAVLGIAALRPAHAQVPLAPMATVSVLTNAIYVQVVGMKTGAFKPEVPAFGTHKGTIEGVKFLSQATSPMNLATGQASGKRQYSPIVLTKVWGPSSPQFLQSLVSNEVLSTVTIEFVRRSPNGQELIFQTIKLTNATVSSMRRYIGISTGAEPPDPRQLEDISFTFQRMEFSDATGTMAADNWI